jgi:hypothetical protein
VRILRARPPDLLWVRRWQTTVEVLCELCAHVARLRRGDTSTVPDVRLLFAPTGPIQEIAIAGDWSARYLTLAHHLDTLLTE